MKKLWLLSPLAILLLAASAQEAAPAGFEQWPVASLKKYDAKLHQDAVTDPHHFAVEMLADFPNDSALLVHRESDGQAEWHETQVDVFFVQSGSATLVVGGTLVNGETVGPHESATARSRAASGADFPQEMLSAYLPGSHISFCWRARPSSTILSSRKRNIEASACYNICCCHSRRNRFESHGPRFSKFPYDICGRSVDCRGPRSGREFSRRSGVGQATEEPFRGSAASPGKGVISSSLRPLPRGKR